MIENIDKNGIIKIKEKNIFVKIIKVKPINFNLKTALEKEAILIHTNKEDISKIINNIKQVKNEQISVVSKNYIKFINKINSEKQTSTKNYYIIIDEQFESDNKNTENIFYMLNEKYLKIKECLTRCGNQVNECKKEEVIRILHFFLNTKNNLKRNGGD